MGQSGVLKPSHAIAVVTVCVCLFVSVSSLALDEDETERRHVGYIKTWRDTRIYDGPRADPDGGCLNCYDGENTGDVS